MLFSAFRKGAGLYNAIGTAYIDSFQLEEGDTANTINLLHNSGFEKSSSGTAAPSGFLSYQTIPLSGKPGFGTIGGYLGGLAFGYIFDIIVSDVIREDLKSCIS